MRAALSEQWPTKRLRYLIVRGSYEKRQKRTAEVSEVSFLPMEAIGEKGQLDLSETRPIDQVQAGYSQFFDGDVVIAKITPCFENGKGALIRDTLGGVGFGTTELYVLTPRSDLDGRYLYYVTVNPSFRQLGAARMTGAAGQQRVPEDFIRDFRVRVPPLAQQLAIADYLDRETTQLDALVAAKERMLTLLAEKRRALITRAVTRGLDLDVPLRDSGIPWYGKVPTHWEIVALRFLVQLVSGSTPDTGKPEYWDGDIPWVSPKDMKQVEISDSQDHVSKRALSESTLRLIETDSVLIVVRGMILDHTFPTALNTNPVTINQDMKALRCCPRLVPHYLRDFFRGIGEHIVSLADTSTHGTRKLETEVLGRLEILLPPLSEQHQIVAYIDEATSRLDALRSAIVDSISLLRERRAALIAAAVTGQLDVEGVA